jgi:hypothetical protein
VRRESAEGYIRKPFAVVAVAITSLTVAFTVALAVAATALAAHVNPTTVAGNPACPPGTTELKVQPVADGTFSDGTLTVTIDVRDTAAGQVFDWTSNIGVDQVIAKGGPSGNVYAYDPEATGDTGLHAPALRSGNWAGLTYVSFCYGGGGGGDGDEDDDEDDDDDDDEDDDD